MTRRLAMALGTVLCALPALPAPGAQAVLLPDVQRSRLRNGMPVALMAYQRAPVFALEVVFRGGAAIDPEGKAGVASLTAEVLGRGTAKRSAAEFAQEVDFLGATIDASAGADGLTVRASGLSRHFAAVLDLVAEMLREPAFDAREVERARELRLSGLRAMREDPGAVASRVAQEIALAGHPYGALETESSVARITRDDLVAFWRGTLAPPNARLVMVGDLPPADALRALDQRLGDWPATAVEPPAPPRLAARPRSVALVDKPDAVQSNVVLIGKGAAASDPDRVAVEVATTILGSGFASRLTEEVRVNRSLTYWIGCAMRYRRAGGSFVIGSFTRAENTNALIDAVIDVVRGAATRGFTDAELRRGVGFLAGQFAIEVQTPGALAGRLAEMELHGLPADHLTGYLARLRSVRLAQVNAAARRWFGPDALSIAVTGRAGTIRQQIERYGDVQDRDLEGVGR
ncbi:MAG TPA: pitrilysin family protein [Chthonomonadales bacterium]|nr:pitrilysin family protein [Chthonomonadales bacterium]